MVGREVSRAAGDRYERLDSFLLLLLAQLNNHCNRLFNKDPLATCDDWNTMDGTESTVFFVLATVISANLSPLGVTRQSARRALVQPCPSLCTEGLVQDDIHLASFFGRDVCLILMM